MPSGGKQKTGLVGTFSHWWWWWWWWWWSIVCYGAPCL